MRPLPADPPTPRPPACVSAQLSTSPPPRLPAAGADSHEGQGANLPAGASDPEPLTAAQPPADASCARAVVAGGAASGQDGEPGTRGTVQVCSHSPFTPDLESRLLLQVVTRRMQSGLAFAAVHR